MKDKEDFSRFLENSRIFEDKIIEETIIKLIDDENKKMEFFKELENGEKDEN